MTVREKFKYQFYSSYPNNRVTVEASSLSEAYGLAEEVLNARCVRKQIPLPERWKLQLVKKIQLEQ